MASVSPMSISASMACRSRLNATAVADPSVAALGQSLAKPQSVNPIESGQNQVPTFYPGFGAQPPLVMRPLMMMDPSSYHHLRRWALRVAP